MQKNEKYQQNLVKKMEKLIKNQTNKRIQS